MGIKTGMRNGSPKKLDMMKKLIYTLAMLMSISFLSCGDDDNKDGDGLEIQDYTSFVIENNYSEKINFYYAIVGYKDEKGVWYKLSDLGHLEDNKPSKEIKLTKYYSEIRLFCKFRVDTDVHRWYDFNLKENRKNILIIENSTQWQIVEDSSDPKQYPQE